MAPPYQTDVVIIKEFYRYCVCVCVCVVLLILSIYFQFLKKTDVGIHRLLTNSKRVIFNLILPKINRKLHTKIVNKYKRTVFIESERRAYQKKSCKV